MIALRIIGFLVAALSATVLFFTLRGLWNAGRRLPDYAVDKPIPLDLNARIIVWGWFLGLLAGIAMIAMSV